METWRQQVITCPSASWPTTKDVARTAQGTIGCVETGHRLLGLLAFGVDMSSGPRFDSPTVWDRVSRGLRGYASAQPWLESTEAGATCPRTKRTGDRSVAPRRMAAAKKRASNVKLAWFFSTKVAICFNHCGAACGLLLARRHCNTLGTDTTESRRWRPLPAPRGRNDSGCTTRCWTTTHVPQMSCDSCVTYMAIFGVLCCSSVIAGRSIVRQSVDCNTMGLTGFPSSGFRHTRQNSTRLKTYGIKQSTVTWPTSSLMTFWKCMT